MKIFIAVMISGALIGMITWVILNRGTSEAELTDTPVEDVGDLTDVLNDDTKKPEAKHEENTRANDLNYTEVLELIEKLRNEIYLINISTSLMKNQNLDLNENQSDSLVIIEHVKSEFREHMKWTEEKLELLGANTGKTIDTVKSRVEQLDDFCASSKSDVKSLREEIGEIRDENKKIETILMKHAKKIEHETEKMMRRMDEVDDRLEDMKQELDTIGVDVTMRVLPNMFNKGYAVFGIFLTFLLSTGAICYLYYKYKELSQSLDELRQRTSLHPKQ